MLVTNGWTEGLRDKETGEGYIENRFESFMYFIVARRMALLSLSLKESFPYKYNFSSPDR